MAGGAALQPRQPRLVGPRPCGDVEWPRLDAALRRAAPHRLRRQHRRPPQLPAAAFEDGGAPRIRHLPRHRDDHRPAGPRARQRRWHGPRRVAARPGVQPGRLPPGGPPDVGARRGRLHDGGRHARSRGPRGHIGTRQAQLPLRRQRHLHRRRDAALAHGGRPGAVRGLWLARRSGRGWSRRRRSARGAHGGGRRGRAAHADLLQDDHRLRGPGEGRHGRGPWSGVGTRRGRRDAAAAQLGLRGLRDSAGGLRGLGHAVPGRPARSGVAKPPRCVSEHVPGTRGGIRAAHAESAAAGLAPAARGPRAGGSDGGDAHRDAQGVPGLPRPPRPRHPGVAGRFRGPHRLQRHAMVPGPDGCTKAGAISTSACANSA